MEFIRKKNVATILIFPILDANGAPVTAAADLDSEIDSWADGAAPDGFADCTNEATEIGATGFYYLALTQAEMNVDYAIIQVKTSTAGARPVIIHINTKYAPTAADVEGIRAKTDNLPAAPAATGDAMTLTEAYDAAKTAAQAGDAMTLTAAYDAAKAAASQATVDTVDGIVDAIKAQTDKLTFTGAEAPYLAQVDVVDWKGAAAPAMTGDAYARLGAPVGASMSADVAAVKTVADAVQAKTDNLPASPAAVGSKMDIADAPTATGANALADALLKRDMSAVAGESARSPINALRALRNKVVISGGTVTVYKENDTDAAWTGAVADSASVDPT